MTISEGKQPTTLESAALIDQENDSANLILKWTSLSDFGFHKTSLDRVPEKKRQLLKLVVGV